MRTQPDDLDVRHLHQALRDHWALHAVSLEYLPVGFGSHHWEARDETGARRFITVDDLRSTRLGTDERTALATLQQAFRAAAALRDEARLEFVVGGVAAKDGRFVQPVADFYAVAVFPFLDGVEGDGEARAQDEDRDAVFRLLGRLHRVRQETISSPPALEDFALPGRDDLWQALDEIDEPWDAGPYGEPARQLLRPEAAAVRRLLRHYEGLAAHGRDTADRWVVTHGEPHSRNLIVDGRGHRFLVDWDTVKLAPAERDLWMVLGEAPDLRPYEEAGGRGATDDRVLDLYRLWWDLSEIASFIRWFRSPHGRSEDTAIAWEALNGYLPVPQRWREVTAA